MYDVTIICKVLTEMVFFLFFYISYYYVTNIEDITKNKVMSQNITISI